MEKSTIRRAAQAQGVKKDAIDTPRWNAKYVTVSLEKRNEWKEKKGKRKREEST